MKIVRIFVVSGTFERKLILIIDTMMRSSNGNILRITDPLWEFAGHRRVATPSRWIWHHSDDAWPCVLSGISWETKHTGSSPWLRNYKCSFYPDRMLSDCSLWAAMVNISGNIVTQLTECRKHFVLFTRKHWCCHRCREAVVNALGPRERSWSHSTQSGRPKARISLYRIFQNATFICPMNR